MSEAAADDRPATLSTWDAVCVVFGIVVGTSLFRAPPLVFGNSSNPWLGMALWGLGGLLSLCGAFSFCELATTYPQLGAEFVFLKRSYGRFVAFLFAWAQLGAVLTGSVGAMAFVFADYGSTLVPAIAVHPVMTAAAVIVFLSAVNLCGLTAGRLTQNVLTLIKLVGLGLIFVAGCVAQAPLQQSSGPSHEQRVSLDGIGLALVFVLYSYGGWNDAALVAGEVRQRERNVPKVLIAGLGSVVLLYLAVNLAYLHGLGYQGLCASQAPAADVVGAAWGAGASRMVSALVMISALGAVNGMLFTGVRLAAALGREHRLLSPLGKWSARGVPAYALLALGAISLVQIMAVGTPAGQAAIDAAARQAGFGPFPWEKFGGGFEALVAVTAPTFWGFFLLTSLSLPILRLRDGARPRPFRVPWYPLTPLLFTAMCAYMLYSSISYAEHLSLIGVLLTAIGAAVYCASQITGVRGS